MKSLFRPSLFVFLLALLSVVSTFVMAQDVASLTGVVTEQGTLSVQPTATTALDLESASVSVSGRREA